MNKLQTGDLILFNGNGIFSSIVEWFTGSDYSHCGIVLKDPTFIHPGLKGLFLWESAYEGVKDTEDNCIKFGVQIVPLQDAINRYNGHTYYRPIEYDGNEINNTVLEQIHGLVHNKPYDTDPIDWIDALFNIDLNGNVQSTDQMFCSAFVALVYTKCGILVKDTDWTVITPKDLAEDECEHELHFTDKCTLGDMYALK